MLSQAGGWRSKTGVQTRAQGAAQPFFPRQGEGALALCENFRRQQVAESFDEKSFLRAWFAPRGVRQGAHKFDQRSIEKRHADFQRARHADGIGIAQQSAGHIGAHFEPGNCRDGLQFCGFIGDALEPCEPGGIEGDAIGADGADAKARIDKIVEAAAGRK